MKRFIFYIFLLIFFTAGNIKAGSFSELFGSEGASGIANPKTRSLSWTMQYLTFTGATGLILNNLYNTGFFEPFGLQPEIYKEMSPLAYDKSLFTKSVNNNLRNSKDIIFRKNEILQINNNVLLKQPQFSMIKKENEVLFNDYIIKKENRDLLIRRLFDER